MDKRIHKVHMDKGTAHAYKYYKKTVIQKGSYKLTQKEYSTILKKYYNLMFKEVIYNNYEFSLGRAGSIKIFKFKHVPKIDKNGNLRYKIINWKKTKELGKVVYDFNDHTEGYLLKFKWLKKAALVNRSLYTLRVSRDIKRSLPKALKENKNLNYEEYGRR